MPDEGAVLKARAHEHSLNSISQRTLESLDSPGLATLTESADRRRDGDRRRRGRRGAAGEATEQLIVANQLVFKRGGRTGRASARSTHVPPFQPPRPAAVLSS